MQKLKTYAIALIAGAGAMFIAQIFSRWIGFGDPAFLAGWFGSAVYHAIVCND